MSRSKRAWMEMESCEPVSAAIGVGERTGLEERAPLGPGSVLGAAFSTTRLVKFLAATVLVIAAAPASALAGSASGQHAKPPIQEKQQAAPIHHAGVVVLAPGSGYLGHGSAAVRVLQSRLARTGYAPGPIDGRYGPRTEQAVSEFQTSRGLRVDGIAGPLTLAALSRPSVVMLDPGAGYATHGSGAVRALQRRLARAGYVPGPIDGRYGPSTEQAVTRYQAADGLQVDGIAGPLTLAALRPAAYPATRPAHPARSRPLTTHRQPTPAPTTRRTVPVSHPTSSPPLALLVLLAVLAVALGLSAVLLGRRRREKRYASVEPATTNGASPSEAITTHPNPTTTHPTPTPQPTTTPHSTTVPTPDHGELDDADRAFRHALLLEEHGDQMGAVAAYQQADQLGHAAAACNLGVLLEQHGDRAGAEASYRRADQHGDANGAFNLGVLLEEQGDQMEAVAAYQRADQRGNGAAACNRGVLLEQHGDRAGAEASYRRADQRGDANGAFNLGVLLEEGGDQVGSLRAYQRADQLGHPAVANMAHAAAVDVVRQIGSPTAAGNGGGHDGS